MLLCYAMMLGFSVKALSRMCSCVSVEALVLALELDLLEPCWNLVAHVNLLHQVAQTWSSAAENARQHVPFYLHE